MERWLVFGLSGMIGQAVIPHLPNDREIVAVSRQNTIPASPANLRWVQERLPGFVPDAQDFETILSLGPLDLFADWLAAHEVRAGRVVAIGSCSLRFKANSPDAGERGIAARLQRAEDIIFDTARKRGIEATILRPTLVYGNGLDRSLTPMLALARRWRVLPLPTRAAGLRQPVHVDDVAGAVFACLRRPESAGRVYELPGGERLGFDAMMRRLISRRLPGVRIVTLPKTLFRLLLGLALKARGGPPQAGGIVHRLALDQIADATDARKDLGFKPRPFEP